ncbi:MAG: potassium channel family protein [Caldilineaceae bacterium]
MKDQSFHYPELNKLVERAAHASEVSQHGVPNTTDETARLSEILDEHAAVGQSAGHLLEDQPEEQRLVDKLVTFYQGHQKDERAAAEARLAFLLMIKTHPPLLQEPESAQFLANKIVPEDFKKLQWAAPTQMLEFCELLYGFHFAHEEVTEQVRTHVQHLLQHALRHFEERADWEQLFTLIQVAPTSPIMDSVELRRLRYLARTYEMRRVLRNQRILYSYLTMQALFVLVIFPFLFINAENGELQRRVEALTDVSIGDEGYRLFSYTDGLYWSIVTAASIGYGDITPMTTTGKMIAAVLGTMGVVTVGVIAGLVLKWVTPRSLD